MRFQVDVVILCLQVVNVLLWMCKIYNMKPVGCFCSFRPSGQIRSRRASKTCQKNDHSFKSSGVKTSDSMLIQFSLWGGHEIPAARADSHTAIGSYHLIQPQSLRVPVDDCVAVGWNTNTRFARSNTGETTPALPSHTAAAASRACWA